MKYAVFFRNVNLGRPKSPTRVQLEQAFLDSGAVSAHSFLTNGTIVFTVKTRSNPSRILTDAADRLHRECGLVEPGFLRSVSYLRKLVDLGPFALVNPEAVYSYCATFLHSGIGSLPEVPLESKRGDVKVLHFTRSEALSVSRKIGNTAGSPNAFLEKFFELPATTRNWNTVVRLVQKHA